MIVKTFSGMINKIATMPGAVCDAELPSPAEQKERVTESEDKGALSDTEPPGDDDKDAFDIDYDLWYPEEQVCEHPRHLGTPPSQCLLCDLRFPCKLRSAALVDILNCRLQIISERGSQQHREYPVEDDVPGGHQGDTIRLRVRLSVSV